MTIPLPEKVIAILQSSPALAGIKEWQAVNGLITLQSPGISVGVNKESFREYDAGSDQCTAEMTVTVWDKEVDPAAGEARVRDMAHAVRQTLLANRTLGGLVDDVFVADVEYVTEDAGSNLLLHIAQLSVQVDYLADRAEKAAVPTVSEVRPDVAPG